jgi:phosphoenolpyruvate carboxylase
LVSRKCVLSALWEICYNTLQKNIYGGEEMPKSIFNLGFWPGGDRDGNPFVTTEITLKVADRLRTSILKCYYTDIRKLKRKLTFKGVDTLFGRFRKQIIPLCFLFQRRNLLSPSRRFKGFEKNQKVIEDHQSLYLDEIDLLLVNLRLFGFHFATLDIRQNSKIHRRFFKKL